jgi:hypothetical protein
LPLLVIALLLMIVPPTVAWAGQFNYAQDTNRAGETFSTTGETGRSYNQVWHQAGNDWWVWYLHGSTQTGLVFDSLNPTKYPGASSGSVFAKCANQNDSSGVTWTCQTTTP